MNINTYWLDDNTQVMVVEGLIDSEGEPVALEVERHLDSKRVYVGLRFEDDRVKLFYGDSGVDCPKDFHGCEPLEGSVRFQNRNIPGVSFLMRSSTR